MKKILSLVLLFLITVNLFSQGNHSSKINFRKTIVPHKQSRAIVLKHESETPLLLVDSLSYTLNHDRLDFLKDFSFFNNTKLFRSYKNHSSLFDKNRGLKQWNVPIKIYFDSNIKKSIVDDFKQFTNSFKGINNLSISYTEDIEDANFYFKIADTEISAYSKSDLKGFSEEQLKNLPFFKMTYKSVGDDNYKLYGCVFTISPSIIKEKRFTDHLKKGFYYSITQFTSSISAPEDAVLNNESRHITTLTDYDYALLKFHYLHLYEFKVNYDTLLELHRIYKANY